MRSRIELKTSILLNKKSLKVSDKQGSLLLISSLLVFFFAQNIFKIERLFIVEENFGGAVSIESVSSCHHRILTSEKFLCHFKHLKMI